MAADGPVLTPSEVTTAGLHERRGRFDAEPVRELFARIADSYDRLWQERRELHVEVERLAGEAARSHELERRLSDVLIAAERAAEDVRAAAAREAERIVTEAKELAHETLRRARAEHEQLEGEIGRLNQLGSEVRHDYRAFLLSALELVEHDSEPSEVHAGT